MFDKDNILNRKALQYIFTTEGHILYVDPTYRVRPWEMDRDKVKGDDTKGGELGRKNREEEEDLVHKMAVARKDDSTFGHSVSFSIVDV